MFSAVDKHIDSIDETYPWESVYHEAAPQLYRFFFAYTRGDVALAEDLVQETFVSAISSHHRFNPKRAGFRTWLWTIARRRLSDALRQRSRGGPIVPFEQIEHALAHVIDSNPLADEMLSRQETGLRIGGVLNSLSEAHQSLLRQKYFDDRSVREIAEAMGKTEKAVESLLTRAREAFSRQFAKLESDEDRP